jgi:hypothetical protein
MQVKSYFQNPAELLSSMFHGKVYDAHLKEEPHPITFVEEQDDSRFDAEVVNTRKPSALV